MRFYTILAVFITALASLADPAIAMPVRPPTLPPLPCTQI